MHIKLLPREPSSSSLPRLRRPYVEKVVLRYIIISPLCHVPELPNNQIKQKLSNFYHHAIDNIIDNN